MPIKFYGNHLAFKRQKCSNKIPKQKNDLGSGMGGGWEIVKFSQ